MLGMVPGAFSVTSHIVITAALAALVFLTVLIVGFAKNGLGFLKLFVPAGVPIFVLPLVTLIEIISFLSRPVSHSVRLFANMLAGHVLLLVFALINRPAIFDLKPGSSLIEFLLDEGFDVFLVDWGYPDDEDAVEMMLLFDRETGEIVARPDEVIPDFTA